VGRSPFSRTRTAETRAPVHPRTRSTAVTADDEGDDTAHGRGRTQGVGLIAGAASLCGEFPRTNGNWLRRFARVVKSGCEQL